VNWCEKIHEESEAEKTLTFLPKEPTPKDSYEKYNINNPNSSEIAQDVGMLQGAGQESPDRSMRIT